MPAERERGELLPSGSYAGTGGRPTKYKPAEMCAAVIELGRQGASKHEMALELDVCIDTFIEWEKQHGEFSEAVKKAMQLSQGWWERQGRQATFASKEFNATAYIFQMKNRFKADWSDRTIQENTGSVKITWGKPE